MRAAIDLTASAIPQAHALAQTRRGPVACHRAGPDASAIRERVLNEGRDFAANELPRCKEITHAESTIAGAEGNLEYFLALKKESATPPQERH